MSRLFKTGLFPQYSLAAEQLYGWRPALQSPWANLELISQRPKIQQTNIFITLFLRTPSLEVMLPRLPSEDFYRVPIFYELILT